MIVISLRKKFYLCPRPFTQCWTTIGPEKRFLRGYVASSQTRTPGWLTLTSPSKTLGTVSKVNSSLYRCRSLLYPRLNKCWFYWIPPWVLGHTFKTTKNSLPLTLLELTIAANTTSNSFHLFWTGDVAQWYNRCLACTRPWIQSHKTTTNYSCRSWKSA